LAVEGRKSPVDPIAATALVSIAAVGIAALVLALALAPSIGDLIAAEPLRFFDDVVGFGLIRPEPTEFVRYAIAAAAPLLMVAAVLGRGGRPLPARLQRAAVPLGWCLAAGALGLALAAWFTRAEPDLIPTEPTNYFSGADGLIALGLAAGAAGLAASEPARARLAGLAAHRRVKAACWAIALGLTTIFLLPAVFPGQAFTSAPIFVASHLPYYLSDFSSMGAGTSPLVDHANHYTHLLPYMVAPLLAAFSWSPGALTVILSALSLLALLSVFRALATTTRSELAGLALYAPVLGLALLPIVDDEGGFVYNANVYSVLPERLLGPFLVAWVCARHLRGLGPRRAEFVFFAAGLAAWNNPEFGLPCLLGAAAACGLGHWTAAAPLVSVRRLATQAAIGILGASALVCAITLVRAGSLPDLDLLLYFSRLSGLQGFVLLPMPSLGIWIAVYLTFGGALVLAAVRAAGSATDRTLTGMLAFSGVLGLGAGVFYVGRSDKFTMTAVLAIWGLALALLAWWALSQRIAPARPAGRRAALAGGPLALAVLVALGLGFASLADPPAPWTEIERLTSDGKGLSTFEIDEERRFVAERANPDEPVLILRENSDLIAIEAGVENVSPVSEPQHVVAEEQLDFVIEALAASGGERIFTGDGALVLPIHEGILEGLRERGWVVSARSPTGRLAEWRQATPASLPQP